MPPKVKTRPLTEFGEFSLQGREKTLPSHLRNTELLLQTLDFGIYDLQIGDLRFGDITQAVDRMGFVAYG